MNTSKGKPQGKASEKGKSAAPGMAQMARLLQARVETPAKAKAKAK